MEYFAAIPPHYVDENLPEGSYLVSAARFWDPRRRCFRVPKTIPPRRYFIDSGAYSFRFVVTYSWRQYADFAEKWSPVAVAALDVFGSANGTVAWLRDHQAEVLTSGLPVVPVITGRSPAEYRWCAIRTAEVLGIFLPRVVAVGAIKGRPDLVAVLAAVEDEAPGWHLFGASLPQLRQVRGMYGRRVASVDGSSWNGRFGRAIDGFNEAMKRTGKTQKRTALDVILPEYRARVNRAVGEAEKT